MGGRCGGTYARMASRAAVAVIVDSSGQPTDVGLRGQVGVGADAPDFANLPSIGGKADYSLAGTFL